MTALERELVAVVFDMDGTLIDSAAVIPDAYIACVEALGGPVYTRRQVIDSYSVGPPRAMLTHLLRRLASPEEVDDYHARLAATAPGVTVYPGIEETLSTLQRRLSLAVFTGASIRACRILLGAAGLVSHFDVLVGADEVARSKPEPDGIYLACERLGVAAASTAYVGDSPNDLEAARRSDALAVAAGWGHQYRADEPSDVVLNQPHDLVTLIERAG